MIGDCLLECELEPGVRRTLAGFENHAGLHAARDGRRAAGPRRRGLRQRRRERFRGLRGSDRAIGTYLHGPLLPRNPWLADWLLARALEHRLGEAPALEALPDELEREAHVVSAARARSRGGRF